MIPEDSSTFYYCFTKLGFEGDGLFYKYLQKVVSKTIGSFEGRHLARMFYKFDTPEVRLNTGVKGRLVDHAKFLLRENKMKGHDATIVYENTRNLEDKTLHQKCETFLQKIRYFT